MTTAEFIKSLSLLDHPHALDVAMTYAEKHMSSAVTHDNGLKEIRVNGGIVYFEPSYRVRIVKSTPAFPVKETT